MARQGAAIARHPIHPMLIPFPIALFVFSLACDIVFRRGGAPLWHDMAFYTMLGGVIGALLAAVPGFYDYVTVVNERARNRPDDARVGTVATTHMALNLTIVVLYVINLYIRSRSAPDASAPFILSIVAIILLVVSGWLGGSLVYVHHVAVHPTLDTTMPHPTFIERPVDTERPVTEEPKAPRRTG